MRKFLKATISLVAILLLGMTVLGWRHFCRPQSVQGSLLASFAGKTNEVGEILILITNCSRWKITYHPRIEVKQSGSWPSLPSNTLSDDIGKPRTIQPFTNEPVALSPPAKGEKWRLFIAYFAATERNKRVQQTRIFLSDIGLSSFGNRIEWDQGGFLFLPEPKDPFDRYSG